MHLVISNPDISWGPNYGENFEKFSPLDALKMHYKTNKVGIS